MDVKEKVYEHDHRHTSPSHQNTNIEVDVSGNEQFVQREKLTVKGDQHKYKRDMGYYDEDGHYHSLRQGLHKAADRILHPLRDSDSKEEIDININMSGGSGSYGGSSSGSAGRYSPPNTITIPCHHVRIGDLLLLQGRICQVIKISISNQTGQYRYLGVDLFGKQLYEETSFLSNPSPNVYVQNMLGPVFKQYRILDISSGSVVAMTDSGDIKQGLPVIDQGGLSERLNKAFDQGRGSVRVLVINDGGNELVVDMKVLRGANL